MILIGLRRILVIQAIAWLACLIAESFCRFILDLRGVYTWPLVSDGTYLLDLHLLMPRFDHLHSTRFFSTDGTPFSYPPGAGLVYAAFHGVPAWAFASSLVLTFCIAAFLFARGLTVRGVSTGKATAYAAAFILLSYPLWFTLQRGNIEIYVWALTALGCWAFYRKRGYSAAACFALAGSMKIYPALYLGLLLSKRQWKEVIFGAICLVAFTVGSLWLLCPDLPFAAHQARSSVEAFETISRLTIAHLALSFDHSLYGLCKCLLAHHRSSLQLASKMFGLFAAATGIALYFLRIRKLPEARQVTAFVCATLVLTFVSFDYTLLHIYTALGFLLFSIAERPSKSDLQLLGLLSLAISPLTELIFRGYTLEGQIKAILLTAALFLAVRQRTPDCGGSSFSSFTTARRQPHPASNPEPRTSTI